MRDVIHKGQSPGAQPVQRKERRGVCVCVCVCVLEKEKVNGEQPVRLIWPIKSGLAH